MNEIDQLRAALAEARAEIAAAQRTITALRDKAHEQQRDSQHHIRNILSVIRSIVRRTITEGEAIEDYQARLDSRLACFTRLQTKILRDPQGLDLGDLIADELLTFGIGLGVQADLDGPPTQLKAKAASVLGLAFHELALLSVESGRPPAVQGKTEVRWRIEASGDDAAALSIEWSSTGQQNKSDVDARSMFAHEAVEQAVAYELGGTVELDCRDDRVHCRFRLPGGYLARPEADQHD